MAAQQLQIDAVGKVLAGAGYHIPKIEHASESHDNKGAKPADILAAEASEQAKMRQDTDSALTKIASVPAVSARLHDNDPAWERIKSTAHPNAVIWQKKEKDGFTCDVVDGGHASLDFHHDLPCRFLFDQPR